MSLCINRECPYWRENEECEAAIGCAGYEEDVEATEAHRKYVG